MLSGESRRVKRHCAHRGADVEPLRTTWVAHRKLTRSTHLVSDVRTGVGDVPAGLGEDALVVVAVEESVLDVALAAVLAPASSADAVGLEAGLLEDNVQAALGGVGACLGDVGLDGEHERVGLLLEGVVGGRLLLLHFSCLGGREGAGGTLVDF